MSISAVPFIRLMAVAGIVLVVATFALEISRRAQERRLPRGASTQAVVALGGLTYRAPESRRLDPRNPVDRDILRGGAAAPTAAARRSGSGVPERPWPARRADRLLRALDR